MHKERNLTKIILLGCVATIVYIGGINPLTVSSAGGVNILQTSGNSGLIPQSQLTPPKSHPPIHN